MKRRRVLIGALTLIGGAGVSLKTAAAPLDRRLRRALSRIGVGPEQADAFARLMSQVERRRQSQLRRALNNRDGTDLREYLKKRLRREAKRAVRLSKEILHEDQLGYFEEYLKLSNEKFLIDVGLS